MTEQSRGGLVSMNGWWAASGLFILLVIVGVAVVLLGGPDPQPSTAAPTPPTPSSAPSTSAQPEEPADAPLTAAPETEWDLFYDVALPTSPTAGPSNQDGRLWSGWAHSPEGALAAAAYLVFATDAPEAATVVEGQAVPGTQAQAYLNQLSLTPPSEPTPGTTPAIGGFRFVDYSDTAARIELLLVANDSAASIPVDLAWQDGDWKIDLETSGGIPRVTRIDGTSGFIPWSAA
ncbi:hypothetical protein [uncultured Cellulomonas sp.]|uniref:hypothetical protein n=1 Tax=uncultured Cellulomonas sp. TaxID=189682 RepID=UPI002629C1D2|nr:hypothetical protein [uncultured Cellulomonas sp.]